VSARIRVPASAILLLAAPVTSDLALAALVALVVRPVRVGLLLRPIDLNRGEQLFVM
jgi:NhaP-type Na+/H+ and K+/H+ antiporter